MYSAWQAEVERKDEGLEEEKQKNKRLEEDRYELSEELAGVVERLEALGAQLSELQVTGQSPLGMGVLADRPALSNINKDDDEERRFHAEPEDIRGLENSSIVTEAGSLPHVTSTSYPPPLAPPTEEGLKADERKTHMLSDVENTLWIQESKDREYLARKPGRPARSTTNNVESAEGFEKIEDPFYIYIPLPPGFTIPQSSPQSSRPPLTFPSQASVFHFPGHATRDQLLAILKRCRPDGEVGEELQDVNIIRVRTHELEWELKNAVRRSMSETEWRDAVGDSWRGEGVGSTYVVSGRDVCFWGQGEGREDGSGKEKELTQRAAGDEVPQEDQSESGCHKDEDEDCGPRIRGGASSPSPDFASSIPSSGSDVPRSLSDCCEMHHSPRFHDSDSDDLLQSCTHRTHILHLQNASHTRMIHHLQEIIKDTEETIQWQDNQLARAHRHIAYLKRKMRARSRDVSAAGRIAELARAEAQVLEKQLNDIHEQVVRFSTKLDEDERRMLSLYPTLLPCDSPKAVELRGGADSPQEMQDPSTEATSFYWFPTVSTLVLLSSPLHHVHFPAQTPLTRVRETLHTLGEESDPHLRQVHAILQAREEAGIPLPDTSNGRQVLVSTPLTRDDEAGGPSSGRMGYEEEGEGAFGPGEYRYERLLREGFGRLDLGGPAAEDKYSLRGDSPTAGMDGEKDQVEGVMVDKVSRPGTPDEEKKFCDDGKPIDEIEHEAQGWRVRSGRSEADSLGIKRGHSMTLPLAPTEVKPMFPTGTSEDSVLSSVPGGRASGICALHEHLNSHSIGSTGVSAWVIGRGSVSDIDSDKDHIDEPERSADFGYKKTYDHSADTKAAEEREGSASGGEVKVPDEQEQVTSYQDSNPPAPYLRGGAEVPKLAHLRYYRYDDKHFDQAEDVSSEEPLSFCQETSPV